MQNIAKILFLCLAFSISAQKPMWADADFRSMEFPREKYITGYSWDNIQGKENTQKVLDQLRNSASVQISQYINLSIKSESSFIVESKNDAYKDYFKNSVNSISESQISGIRYETAFDEKSKTAYVLAYIKKDDLINSYLSTLRNLKEKFNSKIELANKFTSDNNFQKAYIIYLDCKKLIEKMTENQVLLSALGVKDEKKLVINETGKFINSIELYLASLKQNKDRNLEDVCYFIAVDLHEQTGDINKPVVVYYFTFQETEKRTDLSWKLAKILKQKLSLFFNVVPSVAANVKNYYILEGCFRDGNEQIKIIANLKKANISKTLATCKDEISKAFLKEKGIKYKPD